MIQPPVSALSAAVLTLLVGTVIWVRYKRQDKAELRDRARNLLVICLGLAALEASMGLSMALGIRLH